MKEKVIFNATDASKMMFYALLQKDCLQINKKAAIWFVLGGDSKTSSQLVQRPTRGTA